MNPNLYHVLGAKQFSRSELDELFVAAKGMEEVVRTGGNRSHQGAIMTTLFFEASTRTRLSFEAAMSRLGGSVIGTENAAQFSSAIKGETLEDTIRIISGYSDVIVMRHTEIGAAKRAAAVADVPVINAGDGAGEHPTQALLDAYTIQKEVGQLDGVRIAMVGDLAYGRTVHSLSYILANYRNVMVYYISPENVRIPGYVKRYMDEKGIRYEETGDLESVAGSIDVLYQTRIQKERFPSLEEYEKASGHFIVDEELMSRMNKNSIVLHPLPRAGEIADAVDNDPRAAYFRQARNGLYIRMALIDKALSGINR
ncbi:aspartate carbamoyltransferase [Cohnella thailandensis]|uniref:Aspartate carbamoyltransferase n=1 Tax=Cohnella thailandensis TaxID=557557 RepID=A0A841T4M6_9BACL|nr:aspartate carbamoyltransferase [Cohnella thailandensis]MBB6637595.1 aspartate carbamoyltransferase [Cohnella thailandensis]MBP1974229.1 aspartate carbamoyltransferase catalytic subunit [Cohnella thailandensis]